MEQKFLKKDGLNHLAAALADAYRLYYIQRGKKDKLHLAEFSGALNDPVIGEVRPFEPLKNFFFYAREIVMGGEEKKDRPFCILGVKNCDLRGLDITDPVFSEGDFKDPFYARNRERNLVIAADCTKAIDTCFCHALGHKHYPEKNHDILISEAGGGYLLEPVTEKGKIFLEKHKGLFGEAMREHMEERDRTRKRAGGEVDKNIRENEIPLHTEYKDIIKENIESDIWERESENCVECGSCNVGCPTCHCFYLADTKTGRGGEARYKIWDSCMYKRFARVAGGANPRAHLGERLRNRFEKKFDFFPEASGRYACTGCGRCFSGCPAEIDIRKILKDLVAEKNTKAKAR